MTGADAKHWIEVAGTLAAIAAAVLWAASAKVSLSIRRQSVGDGKGIGMAELNNTANALADAFASQSRLSFWAAVASAGTALTQAILIWINWT